MKPGSWDTSWIFMDAWKKRLEGNFFIANNLHLLLKKGGFFVKLPEMGHSKISPFLPRFSLVRFFGIFSLVLFFIGAAPFAHALEIHHLFSEIDHDSHQHSEFDLCQWVKHHTGNSLAWDLPQVSHGSLGNTILFYEGQITYHFLSFLHSYSRGPPLLNGFSFIR